MPDSNTGKNAEPDSVTVTNVSRRPLLVQTPGGTLRLGPGERRNISKSWLATAEIRRLRDQRLMAVSPAGGPEPDKAPWPPAAAGGTEPQPGVRSPGAAAESGEVKPPAADADTAAPQKPAPGERRAREKK